jgi:hypothetical protein
MKRLLALAAIETFVWLLLLIVTFIISKGALEISFGSATLLARVATQIVRVVASGTLVLIWLFAWKKVADLYLSRTLSRQRTSV